MILKKLSLHNIRSYEEEIITFPKGHVLLSGDIGSGKTTILLAVEFALFGLLRGILSGSTLLRHGKDEGTVTLTVELDETVFTIHRTLKRNKNSIRQDTGWYSIDGDKTEASATEIRAKVVELLGYPQSMSSGSKNMVYRYSVYTPQEMMKQILTESSSDRLEKIRQIFRIDKYQRIRSNSETYRKELRSRIRSLEDVKDEIDSLKEKKNSHQEKKREGEKQKEEAEEKKQTLVETKNKVEEKLEGYEDLKETYQTLKTKRDVLASERKNLKKTVQTVKKRLQKQQKIKEKELPTVEKPEISSEELDTKEKAADTYFDKVISKISVIEGKNEVDKKAIRKKQKRIEDIDTLDRCPTCEQDITEKHKEHIHSQYQDEIDTLREKIEKRDTVLSALKEKKQNALQKRKTNRKLRKELQEYEKKKTKMQELKKQKENAQDSIDELLEEKKELREQIETKNKKYKKTCKQIEDHEEDVEEMKTCEDEKKDLEKQIQTVNIKIAEAKQIVTSRSEALKELNERIEEKEKKKDKLGTYQEYHAWLKEHFENLTDVIEQHVLQSLHRAFNDTFRSYFDHLIEDDVLSADIDTEFSPRVTQNGYDTDVENLSGGEKTSVALAYRLALNYTINDLLSDVKTRNLLILDEPTDGFSAEQLDRLRDVLDKLDTQQTIIVSHEPKMEGITERILHVTKRNNTSVVTSNQA